MRSDDKYMCAVTEKLTFEICADLFAYQVKAVLGTIQNAKSRK